MSDNKLSANEGIKTRSNYLRGTISEGIRDASTGSMSEDDQQLLKFHGTYQQDDRDLRSQRRSHKLEKAFSFMIRIRLAGGVSTPKQWLEMDRLAEQYGNGTFKLTTRQAYQLHGIIKSNLKRTISEINDAAMDTIAACGDVNRNVMCNPNPDLSSLHKEAVKIAQDISDHLTPRTKAYHEIWLDGEKVESSQEEEEPIYGKTYLPRKFKIAVAIPPSNDVDVYAHDLSFILIEKNGKIEGYNVVVGGGMGMTHGEEETYPQIARSLGFVTSDEVTNIAEQVVRVQKEFGDRVNRKHARLKYTIDDRGIDWFKEEVEKRLGYKLEAAKPFKFDKNGDSYGWAEDDQGKWHYTMFVEGGRVIDDKEIKLRTGLKEIAEVLDGEFRLTANQNLVISSIAASTKIRIEKLINKYGLNLWEAGSHLRLNSIACVALPTCALALAESERYLPKLVGELENVIEEAGLRANAITIRMTGCPNGCARPYLAEIAFVGRGPNRYNLYLGGGFAGERLNKLWKKDVNSNEILSLLEPIIKDYGKHKNEGEPFGDFVIRKGYINSTKEGRDFHEGIPK